RDIVSRSMFQEMQAGRTGPMGGVFLEMAHLGPENVARQFKGMVKRCADCGFDLAAGRVEVVPTAHYMMGGIEFDLSCRTDWNRLFVAGEDCGGVHGANRLGGNGVANSTVFGGIAGDSMAAFLSDGAAPPDPDLRVVDEEITRALSPFARPASNATADLNVCRDRLYRLMWGKVGIVRDAEGLSAALGELEDLDNEVQALRLPDAQRSFNLTWHDRLNLENQILVSKIITVAARARENSCGAHFREDFSEPGPLEATKFTSVRVRGGRVEIENKPVAFELVRPGETLVNDGSSSSLSAAANDKPGSVGAPVA
ncbi:MAG: FAD-binding protein, partial [Kiloniellales bacterium]|nr:FAD-binding protein [Kiloniellales bacterium]